MTHAFFKKFSFVNTLIGTSTVTTHGSSPNLTLLYWLPAMEKLRRLLSVFTLVCTDVLYHLKNLHFPKFWCFHHRMGWLSLMIYFYFEKIICVWHFSIDTMYYIDSFGILNSTHKPEETSRFHMTNYLLHSFGFAFW